jgi:hypothetical protein
MLMLKFIIIGILAAIGLPIHLVALFAAYVFCKHMANVLNNEFGR